MKIRPETFTTGIEKLAFEIQILQRELESVSECSLMLEKSLDKRKKSIPIMEKEIIDLKAELEKLNGQMNALTDKEGGKEAYALMCSWIESP